MTRSGDCSAMALASTLAVVSASDPTNSASLMSVADAAPMARAVERPERSPLGAMETRATSPTPAASTSWSAISTP